MRHYYSYDNKKSYIIVDCETDTEVWEGGLDKQSSLDSIQQAIFFSILTGKRPAVIIYNTDKKLGTYEYRIGQVAKQLNIKFTIR